MILKTPSVITLSGKGGVGKSTSLVGLINYFISKKYNVYKLNYINKAYSAPEKTLVTTMLSESEDYLVYVEISDNVKCGISTAGDYELMVVNNLQVLRDAAGCSVFVTPTRSSGKTVTAAEAFAKEVSGSLLMINKLHYSCYTNLNLPEFLFNLIINCK